MLYISVSKSDANYKVCGMKEMDYKGGKNEDVA